MSSTPDRTRSVPLNERTGFLANKVAFLLVAEVETGLQALELSTRSFLVLSAIDHDPPFSQQDLSRLLGIDPTTMVALVDDLERRDFVRRERSTRDRRRYDLLLTGSGADAVGQANGIFTEIEGAFLSPLSDAERAALHEMLGRLLADRWPPR